MKEASQSDIKKITNKIHRDALIEMSDKPFLVLTYHPSSFKNILDEDTFTSVVSFLPNTKHSGRPFIMSVSQNKRNQEIEITVANPRV